MRRASPEQRKAERKEAQRDSSSHFLFPKSGQVCQTGTDYHYERAQLTQWCRPPGKLAEGLNMSEKTELGALVALFAGALSTGAAGVLVRLAETGPTATAFWRGCLALPALALWALLESRVCASDALSSPKPPASRWRSAVAAVFSSFREPGFLWAGVFFAGDLALWNSSLLLTSIAASTLESSLAPVLATFMVWVFWRERPTARFLVATAFALLGMLLIVSPKLGHGGSALLGDALGLGTAVFFAAYILAIARLRASHGTGLVMFNSTLVFTVLLLPLALAQKFIPDTARGWAVVAAITVLAHLLGQGLIAYALAHLRPTFSSLGLLLQTLGAAASAWLVLGERLGPLQIVGALVVVGAVAVARSARPASVSPVTMEPVATAAAESLGVVRD
jgi:drug/metabolite transporter (DMT)-like permease